MANSQICKFNKFGHCRYGEFCNFKHIEEKCDIKNCDAKSCQNRHPRSCRYVKNHEKCKFGLFCSFEHNIFNIRSDCHDDIKVVTKNDETIADKIARLEKVIQCQSLEINKLAAKLERFEALEEEACENVDEEAFNIVTEKAVSAPENDKKDVQCDQCNFRSNKKSGLRIHETKMHKEVLDKVLELENPEYSEYFIQKSEISQCLDLHKLSKKIGRKLVVRLHTKECWFSTTFTCCEFISNPEGIPTEDNTGLVNCLMNTFIITNKVNWEELYCMMVGFDLEKL